MLAKFSDVTKKTDIQEQLVEDMLIQEATQEELARSLHSLIKSNNGLFKSEKQGHFLRNQAWSTADSDFDEGSGYLKQAGVSVDKNKHTHVLHNVQSLNFNPHFGARAGRGAKQSHSVFLMDKHGVVSHHKLGQTEGEFNPKKTTTTFERPAGIATGGEEHRQIADEEPLHTSQHLGKVGEKISHDVTVDRIHNLGPSKFGGGYGRPGPDQFMTAMKTDDGHHIHHYGTPPASLKGYTQGASWTGKVSGEVKKHHVDRNGNNVTILTRPKFEVKSKPEEKKPDFPGRHDMTQPEHDVSTSAGLSVGRPW